MNLFSFAFIHFYGPQFSYHPLDEPVLLWAIFNSVLLNPSSYGLVILIQRVVKLVLLRTCNLNHVVELVHLWTCDLNSTYG